MLFTLFTPIFKECKNYVKQYKQKRNIPQHGKYISRMHRSWISFFIYFIIFDVIDNYQCFRRKGFIFTANKIDRKCLQNIDGCGKQKAEVYRCVIHRSKQSFLHPSRIRVHVCMVYPLSQTLIRETVKAATEALYSLLQLYIYVHKCSCK